VARVVAAAVEAEKVAAEMAVVASTAPASMGAVAVTVEVATRAAVSQATAVTVEAAMRVVVPEAGVEKEAGTVAAIPGAVTLEAVTPGEVAKEVKREAEAKVR